MNADPLPASDSLSGVLREYAEATGRLQQTHLVLQRELGRLRAELASKDRELELRRRLAALGEMAAGVAHEVRNPLAAIQLYSGLLRAQCSAKRLEPALQLIEKIDAGIQAIEAVVQDTLALAPRDRQLAVFRLTDIVARARDGVRPVLERGGVSIDVHFDDENTLVRADENGLQRAVLNLLVNAAEASPAGRAVRVLVQDCGADEVEIQVADEGGGIPEEIRHRVFEPFFTTKPRGTGLGLTIAHRLTEAYGGRLRARNRPEGGAEFTLTLPRVVSTTAGAEETEAGHPQFNAA